MEACMSIPRGRSLAYRCSRSSGLLGLYSVPELHHLTVIDQLKNCLVDFITLHIEYSIKIVMSVNGEEGRNGSSYHPVSTIDEVEAPTQAPAGAKKCINRYKREVTDLRWVTVTNVTVQTHGHC